MAEQQGGGGWQWHRLLLGRVLTIDFDLGDGVESQSGIGQDLWPERWQKVGIREEWDWRGLWTWGMEMKKWLPPKFWVVWWRVLRRNVMLNFRSGHLVPGEDFECEECQGVGQEGGVVQTPEYWLGECEVLARFWEVVESGLGGYYRSYGISHWEVLKKRMLGGIGDEWLTLGWALVIWVGLADHWQVVFEESRLMSKEEKVARWEGLLVDLLSGWQKGWGPQGGHHQKLVEAIYDRSEGRVQVEGGEVVFTRVEVGK